MDFSIDNMSRGSVMPKNVSPPEDTENKDVTPESQNLKAFSPSDHLRQ